jgi:DNA repair protein RecN (Recombination protein N)
VARLLRQQGGRRQVLAVTHNPVIAAAADRHFVVTKGGSYATSSGDGSGSGSGGGTGLGISQQKAGAGGTVGAAARSTVREVSGDERVREIARMATGRLETDAGLTLARALLGMGPY